MEVAPPQIKPSKKLYELINFIRASAIMEGKRATISRICDLIIIDIDKKKLWERIKNERLS